MTQQRIRASKSGFTLIEVMIAMVILAGVVLTIGMGTTKFSRSVRSADLRNQAQSVADMQIGRARAWPTYATLSSLSTAAFNTTADGFASATTVVTDTTLGQSITKVTVTVTSVPASALPTPVKRSIILAAP